MENRSDSSPGTTSLTAVTDGNAICVTEREMAKPTNKTPWQQDKNVDLIWERHQIQKSRFSVCESDVKRSSQDHPANLASPSCILVFMGCKSISPLCELQSFVVISLSEFRSSQILQHLSLQPVFFFHSLLPQVPKSL